jgi:glycosyltransferase involved in cell wall biosynthesis
MRSFSIIIPFKTGKSYLLECVHSVLAQTYPHYLLIILTDPTSNEDGAIDAIEALQHPAIEIVSSTQHLDILGNWARIKEVSHAEYMTILGYDDVLYPHFLATINDLIDKHPTASLYHTHFNYIDKNGQKVSVCKPLPEKLTGPTYLSMSLQDQVSIMATGYVFKTNHYVQLGGISTQYPNLIYADLQLWIDLAQISYMATSAENAFAFRIHASTTKISKDKVLLDALFVFLQYLKKLSNSNNTYHQVIQQRAGSFLEQTTKSIAHRLLRTPIANRQGLRISYMVQALSLHAQELGIKYHPEKIKSFAIAVVIEKNIVLSKLFLLFKSIYKKPVL